MTFPRSDHFNGKTFSVRGQVDRSLADVIRWRRSSSPPAWPSDVPLASQPPPSPLPKPRGDEWVFTWIGHATFLIRTAARGRRPAAVRLSGARRGREFHPQLARAPDKRNTGAR